MPAERYFIDLSLQTDKKCELTGSEFHHFAHVMRGRKDDFIEIVNGKGLLAEAEVMELKKDKAILLIRTITQSSPPPFSLILAQAIPKANRLDLILEKGTELGVDSFWLFPGHFSGQKECYPSQLERAKTVTISAMKQCGRLFLPKIDFLPSIDHWEIFHKVNGLQGKIAFFGDLDPKALHFEDAWTRIIDNKEKEINEFEFSVVFITGPEGGLSKEEEILLRNMHAEGVKLHSNILRTETASIMAISLLSHWLMDV